MPPKKKGKGKGGKKKGKKGKDDVKLEIEEKYQKTVLEIAALKDQLAQRRELTLRAQSAKEEAWRRAYQTEQDLLEKDLQQKAVASEITRQYKTKQVQLGVYIDELETEVKQLRMRLEHTEYRLQKTTEEKDRIIQDKEAMIIDLQMKIDSMEMSFKTELHDAMDSLLAKFDESQQRWTQESTMIQAKNKNTLLEFGLNPLDI